VSLATSQTPERNSGDLGGLALFYVSFWCQVVVRNNVFMRFKAQSVPMIMFRSANSGLRYSFRYGIYGGS